MKTLGSAVFILVLSAVPASAAGGVTIDAVDISAAPELSVVVSLSADAASGRLAAADFAVVVGGQRVGTDVFALLEDPMEVVLAIDTSGSMEGSALDAAKLAARGFVDGFPSSARFAVVSFGDRADTIAVMGTPRDAIAAALDSLSAGGETALYDAVVVASGLFTDSSAHRVVVVLSDGGDTVSSAGLDEAKVAAATNAVDVRTVGLDSDEADASALAELSTTGTVTAASGAADLAVAYESVSREITGRYRLAFHSPAGGTIAVTVYVDTAGGIVSASRVIDLATGAVIGERTPDPPPTGFGVDIEPPATKVAAPVGLGKPWSLPVGVGLVFVGVALALWLTTHRDGADVLPAPLEGLQTPDRANSRLLSATLGRVRALGDGLARRTKAGAVDGALDQAGVALRPGEYVVIAATGVVLGVTAGLVVAGTAGAVVFGAVAASAPGTLLRFLTARRRRAFADQLEGCLQTIAGSLRAGYGLVQAIATVAAEFPSPTSDEFNRVVVETRLGRTVEQSMRAMALRLKDEDLGWVVEAIEIQREVGGNLAEVLDTVTETIRDRNQIRRQVRALSAEGRMSGYILLALPFVIGGFIAIISPDYLSELTSTAPGRIMLGVAAALMVAGAAWIRRIVRVEF